MESSSPMPHLLSKSIFQLKNENQQLHQKMSELLLSYYEQSQQKDELLENDVFYRNLVEQFSEGIAIVIQKRVAYINPAGTKLLGASDPSQIIGQTISNRKLLIHRVPVEDPSEKEVGHKYWQNLDTEVSRLDGSTFIADTISFPIKYQNQQAIQIIIIDKTSVQKMEGALNYIKDLIEDLINYLPSTFYIIDEKLNYLRWNKNHETVIGYSSEEISHLNVIDTVPEEKKEETLQAIKKNYDRWRKLHLRGIHHYQRR